MAAAVLSIAFAGSVCAAAGAAEVHTIDLPTTLRLAGSQNLDIQIARERLAEARANVAVAQAQFFPWLAPGVSYRKHEGRVQAVDGTIFDASKQTLVPGLTLNAQVDPGEAHFRALAARQLAKAADFGVNAQQQETALAAVLGYFDLLFAQAAAEVARDAIRISTNYQAQIERAVEAGVAYRGDALRVKVQAERNRLALRQVEEQRALASTRLAQVLNLDPAIQLAAPAAELVPLSLADIRQPLGEWVRAAMIQRPELKQTIASHEAARAQERGAVYGPMAPSVSGQIFAGGLAGGTGGSLANFGDQQDFFLGLSWRIGPGGLFDQGRVKAAQARARAAEFAVEKVHDDVTRQVVDAAVRMRSLADQIESAKAVLEAAEAGLDLAQQRKEFAVGIVLESIQSEQDLTRARLDYFRAVADFNKAQYQLLRAIGRSF